MMAKRGAIMVGAGASAAGAAAALYIAATTLAPKHAPDRPVGGDEAGFVCLRTDIAFLAGAGKGCLSRGDVAALSAAPVLDDSGAPVSVSLSHPTDYDAPQAQAATCGDYRRLTADGWYALSTRELRREAWFVRACGVLDMLGRARAPDVSHFEDGRMAQADAAQLAAGPPFLIGESAQAVVGAAARIGDAAWRISYPTGEAVIQEIAHADFNFDGRGDIFVFVSLSAQGGTATASETGLVEKNAADGPVRFVKAE